MDLWTETLDLLSQVITPVWATLLQYLPLLLIGLTVLTLLLLARMWRHNSAINKARVPAPLPAGPAPAGVHLPPPSIWPFVAPIGLFLVFLALAVGGGESSFINIPIAVVGAVIAIGATIGWYLDANREYDHLETHDDGLRLVAETDGRQAAHEPPAGVHLPGPSAWPFLAPIGLFFVFLGLALGPVLILGGAIMAIIATVGWYLDAGDEYRQVEEGHHAEPRSRDPEKAFPKALVPVFVGVGVLAVMLTLGPWLLTLLPTTATSGDEGPPPTTTPHLSASSVTSFDQSGFVIPADTPTQLTFENTQAGVEHDVAIYTDDTKSSLIFDGEPVLGPGEIVYDLPPMGAGEYPFVCTIHPVTMVGTVMVSEGPPRP